MALFSSCIHWPNQNHTTSKVKHSCQQSNCEGSVYNKFELILEEKVTRFVRAFKSIVLRVAYYLINEELRMLLLHSKWPISVDDRRTIFSSDEVLQKKKDLPFVKASLKFLCISKVDKLGFEYKCHSLFFLMIFFVHLCSYDSSLHSKV